MGAPVRCREDLPTMAPELPRAVIFYQPGTPHPKQLRTCLAFCDDNGIQPVAIVPSGRPSDAVRMVHNGDADLVVAAFATRHPRAGDLWVVAVDAGVRVRYAREPRLEAGRLIAGIYHRSGGDASLAARLLGTTTANLTAALARLGIRRNGPAPSPQRGGRGDNDR